MYADMRQRNSNICAQYHSEQAFEEAKQIAGGNHEHKVANNNRKAYNDEKQHKYCENNPRILCFNPKEHTFRIITRQIGNQH